MTKVKCSHCQNYFPRDGVGIHSRSKNNVHYWCRGCNTRYCKAARKRSMKSTAEAVKRYEAKNKHRRIAWEAARSIPLEPCEKCGSEVNVHKHHDDYSKPLSINHFCAPCHKARHRELKALGIKL